MSDRGLVVRALAGAVVIGLLVALLGAAVWLAVSRDGAGGGSSPSSGPATAATPTAGSSGGASSSSATPTGSPTGSAGPSGSASATPGISFPASAPPLAPPTSLGRTTVASAPVSPFAECGLGGQGRLFENSEAEPQVAVDPRTGTVVATWQQDRWSNGAARGLVVAASTDGGATWRRSTPAFSACAAPDAGLPVRVSDPWVSFGPDGTGYLTGLSVTGPDVTWVTASRSADGGRTWSTPVAIVRSETRREFNDKESVTADPTRAGAAYVVWDRGGGGESESGEAPGGAGEVLLSTTTDGGQSWSEARPIASVDGTPVGNVVAVTPDGTLVDAFVAVPADRHRPSRILTIRSIDAGATWSAPVEVASFASDAVLGAQPPGIRGGGGLPSIAADPGSGVLHLAWTDGRNAEGRVALATSSDGGASWSTPASLPRPSDTPVFLPAIAIAPGGAIGIEYGDLRAATAGRPFLMDRFLSVSTDGGATWRERRLTRTFDLSTAPDAGGRFVGDYSGLTATSDGFVSAFAVTTGSPTNPTDLVVRVDPLADPAAVPAG
ncbi:MAG TPA: sialidase family protein [Candidatus Limnocylindrales bacterium]|nr:sialidase family protein [Candidatus Limnocylindrales bacterium]